MMELTRTNDPVFLSWLIAALRGAGVDAIVLDSHASVMEGSISAIQRRVMVAEGDHPVAARVLARSDSVVRDA